MKKFLLCISVLVGFVATAQEQEQLYSFNFENVNLSTAIDIIEAESDFRFYFDPSWVEDDFLISENYINQSMEDILYDVLRSTKLNFLILENRVILSKGNLIHNDLPSDYFGEGPVSEEKAPIFYQQYENVETETQDADRISFIGKESKTENNNLFEITGFVRDTKTGVPVPFATVRAQNGTINAVTNEDGHYQIKLPTGLNTLEISSVGFQPYSRQLMVYSNGELNFNLTESVNQLGEVVISGESKRNVRSAVTGVTSINIEEMKTIPMVLGERDIFKAAIIMPGVKTAGEGSAGFNVRGGKSDQNLILLDNGVIYNPFHFLGFFSAVNAYLIGGADIYKGSIPAEFGGRLSSVFDITTKKPDMEKFSGEGGIGPVTANLTASIPIIKNKASVLVGGRATYSDWILKQLDEPELKNSEASFYDGLIKYVHDLNENNSVEATGYYSHDKFSITSDSLYKYSNSLVSMNWKHKFNDDLKSEVILTHSGYEFGIEYQPNNPNAFEFDYRLSETQFKTKFDHKLNDKHDLTYGLSTKLYQIEPGNFAPTNSNSLLEGMRVENEKGLESALFLSDSYKISDELLLSAGLRYSFYAALGGASQQIYEAGLPLSDATVIDVREFDENEVIKTYGGLEYRISARYLFADDFSIKGSFDTNKQYIHLLSSNTTQSPTDSWKLSDYYVKPQTSRQYSIGLFKNFNSDIYQVSLEGYYKSMEDIMDYKVGAQLLLNENLETELLQGKGKAYGVEFLLKKTEGKLNGWLGYSYSRTFIKLDSEFNEEIVNNGEYFPSNFDKPHDLSLVLNYKLTKRYSFSANFIYQTGRPITYPVGTYQYGNAEYTLYSDRNAFRIPDYYRLDLGVNIEGNHKIKKLAHSFWNISIYNVLGRNNPYSVYFVTEEGEIKGYKTSIFSIPVPTITYNFKF
ncbi:MAG TPA: TonB-dependent receptor [Salinimicrobium sp.]|nr:TonB-dependent receptor [Salinimicrobium sp.]